MNKILLIDADPFMYIDGYKETELEAKASVVDRIKTLCEVHDTDLFCICLSNMVNFRKEVDDEYKANRSKLEKPPHYKALREMLLKIGGFSVHSLEADDLVALGHLNAEEETLICSIDKDVLHQVPGTHWNFRYTYDKDTEELDIGDVVTTSEEDADSFLYTQIAMGDSTDNIKGLKGVGIKTAEKIVKKGYEEVLKEYIKRLGIEKGTKEFIKTYKLVYILRRYEDVPEDAKSEVKSFPVLRIYEDDNPYGYNFMQEKELTIFE